MYGTPQPKQDNSLYLLGLQGLANYVASGLVKPGERMHEELAIRLARRLNREGGGKE